MAKSLSGRIGLIGDPVEHSLSPAFQQAALDSLDIPIRYELLHTPAAEIPRRIEELRSGSFLGANVTVPHKEVFAAQVDELSPVAKRVGAVNTINVRSGLLHGDNTDVHGFVAGLGQINVDIDGKIAVILGAGGASRAAVVGLLDQGIATIALANRTIERAQAVADDLGDPRIAPITLGEVGEYALTATLIVNATSLGWNDEALPIDSDIFSRFTPGSVAYDLTYQKTAFLEEARIHGLTTLDGLPMLVHQGARSFEIWTGQEAPFDTMWQAATQARKL